MLILRKILPLLAVLSVSLGIAAPSAAAQLHRLNHATTQVAAGEHHHHVSDGSVEVHQDEPDDDDADKDREAKGLGHSHASSAAGEVIEAAAAVTVSVAAREAPLTEAGAHKLPALEPPPRERPPRTA